MSAEVRWFLGLVFIVNVLSVLSTPPHAKFEYKYSFKPPYLAQKDGSVPFWTYGGNAIASSESVRLAPSMKSQKGGMWTKAKTSFDWWEVDILFRITGRGRVGADGLAFWYTESQGDYDGQVFGSSDKWRGLGVFFDSFDNDNKHNNPYIMAVANDGTREFDHQNDGGAGSLAGCLRDFRNKPYPTRAKIEYYKNTLTVLFHNGMTNNDKDFELCLRVENVFLPKNGYFGLSAATGGLADDHDVLHFLTTSLWGPGQSNWPETGAVHEQVSPEEENKLTQEYAEYQKKLDHQREEYKKEHPGSTKDKDPEFDEWFETDSQRELRQIFSGQSHIYEQVKKLSSKLDEVIGRQERTLSLVSGGAVQHVQQPGMAQQPMMTGSIQRHEVEALMANQNAALQLAREMRALMGDINSRTESIAHGQAGLQFGGGGDSANAGALHEVRDALKSLQQDAKSRTAGPAGACASTCVSPLVMGIFSAVQLVILLGYFFWRDRQEHQYKKFY